MNKKDKFFVGFKLILKQLEKSKLFSCSRLTGVTEFPLPGDKDPGEILYFFD